MFLELMTITIATLYVVEVLKNHQKDKIIKELVTEANKAEQQLALCEDVVIGQAIVYGPEWVEGCEKRSQ